MSNPVKRISLMIREDQHQKLLELGVNVSGLVRDLIDDYLSDHRITLSVGKGTLKTYNQVLSNTGSTDKDLEPYVLRALKELLSERIAKMEDLKQSLSSDRK